MSKKNKDGGFNNLCARKFRDVNKVDLMSQNEVFKILDEDLQNVLNQISANRNHEPGARYPQYIETMFANLSVILYLKNYVEGNVKVTKKFKMKTELSPDDIISLKEMLAVAYRNSKRGTYQNQIQEYGIRNKMILKTFIQLDPGSYALLGKLKLEKCDTKEERKEAKIDRMDLCIQMYGDPVTSINRIHRTINKSNVSNKKKLNILKAIYGKRFKIFVGAAMTVDSTKSDCIEMLCDFANKKSKKRRAKYLKAYADAYKKVKHSNQLKINDEFMKRNKPMIKELIELDIGYRKAFKNPIGAKSMKKEGKENGKGKPWLDSSMNPYRKPDNL